MLSWILTLKRTEKPSLQQWYYKVNMRQKTIIYIFIWCIDYMNKPFFRNTFITKPAIRYYCASASSRINTFLDYSIKFLIFNPFISCNKYINRHRHIAKTCRGWSKGYMTMWRLRRRRENDCQDETCSNKKYTCSFNWFQLFSNGFRWFLSLRRRADVRKH